MVLSTVAPEYVKDNSIVALSPALISVGKTVVFVNVKTAALAKLIKNIAKTPKARSLVEALSVFEFIFLCHF